VTRTLVTLRLVTADPALLQAADSAVGTAYALGDATGDDRQALRDAALGAHEDMLSAAAASVGTH